MESGNQFFTLQVSVFLAKTTVSSYAAVSPRPYRSSGQDLVETNTLETSVNAFWLCPIARSFGRAIQVRSGVAQLCKMPVRHMYSYVRCDALRVARMCL